MSKRQVQIVILCEDRTQEVLSRRYLTTSGFDARKIRFEIAPTGRRSGEQFVRENYPREVAEYRRRNPLYWRLIVIYDADTGTVAEHERELASALIGVELPPRSPTEGIVHLIPKRNIETWIHVLLGDSASEEHDYKPTHCNQDCRDYCQPAAEQLLALVRNPSLLIALPSLQQGVVELRTVQ